MNKRFRRALLALLAAQLISGAQPVRAGGLTDGLTGNLIGTLSTPAPAMAVERGEFRLKLPKGLVPLSDEELAGYEAAARFDFPIAAKTLLAATNSNRDAALLAAEIDSDADCLDLAREAADALLGYPGAARELAFGENRCAGFGCAIGRETYRLYFLSDGKRALLIATAGLDSEDVADALSGLRF